jgi:hypothetical protein
MWFSCGCVDCFVAMSQKWRIIISHNAMQSSSVSIWGRALPIPTKGFRKKFGNDPVSCAQVFQWHKDFVSWQEVVAEELQAGPPVREQA